MLLRFRTNLLAGRGASADKTFDPKRDIKSDVTEADFIPYACHFSPDTLLTKNGELLQILRIDATAQDLHYEPADSPRPSLRQTVRDAIEAHVGNRNFAFWFHTLRRRIPIAHTPQFGEAFAGKLHDAWQKAHSWRYAYVNEIYVSVLRQGQTAEMLDFASFAAGLRGASGVRRQREVYLESAEGELTATTDALLASLSPHFRARRLGVYRKEQASISEPLSFLHYLLNLTFAEVPLDNIDTSRQLAHCDLTFGFDALESRSPEGERRFGAVLTLKGAPELSPEALDRCLQLPEEMIIAQSFNFVGKRVALKRVEEARELLEANPENELPLLSGMSELIASDRGRPTDFGQQQTSIMVVRNQYKKLDDAAGRIQTAFASLGLISVREDVALEECFWAQLPGNFEFVHRNAPLPTRHAAGLIRLNHFPTGEAGSAWGSAVAVLPTTLETPYRFHFHVGNIGHTALIDFNSFADERGASLANFLIASSRHFGGRTIILDRHLSARPLVAALGGHYHRLADKAETPTRLNPLLLEDTPRNRAFLLAWLSHFLAPDTVHAEGTREQLQAALEETLALPPEARHAGEALRRLGKSSPGLVTPAALQAAGFFAHAEDTLAMDGKISAVALDTIVADPALTLPAFAYLLHRALATLDGAPTIIVIHEAWDVLANDFFTPRMASLFTMLTQNNAMLLLSTRKLDQFVDAPVTAEIMAHTPTKLFIPDDVPVEFFPALTGLSADEANALGRLERQQNEFLIRHGEESVSCRLPVEGIEPFVDTLAGDARTLRMMQLQHLQQ